MFKNLTNQKILIYAWDSVNSVPKTGDAANITAYLSKDVGSPVQTDDEEPTELDATNMKGYYYFNMLQAESNADLMALSSVSATAGIQIEPVTIYTVTPMRGTDDANTVEPDPAGTGDIIAALIDALENISSADVNTQVADVMDTDESSDPSAGAFPENASIREKIDYLFMIAARKRVTNNSTGQDEVYDFDGTKIAKGAISDDGSIFTRNKLGAV